MKNFVKAIALATVLCMVLSVSAFATGVAERAEDTITIDAVAGAGDQVAILVVAAGTTVDEEIDPNSIVYVDQVEADATTGAVERVVIALPAETPLVDVYIGSKTFGKEPILKEVAAGTTITYVADSKILVDGKAEANNGYGAAISVEIPDGVSVEKMIWAFKVDGTWRFSSAVANDFNESVVAGQTQFAAAFNAVGDGGAAITVDEFAVIFKTTANTEATPDVVGTADDLIQYKKN